MLNAISIDVEEYFQATNLDVVVGRRRWSSQVSRAEYATKKTLDLLDRSSTKGTFFVLGYVARRLPGLVKSIVEAGHEIASHGYFHRLAYLLSPLQFSRDVRCTKVILEDCSGQAVFGYRAPNFSILKHNSWAYDKLIEAGYLYDSSLYPVRHPRYSNPEGETAPFVVKRPKGELIVLPLAVCRFSIMGLNMNLPVAGGAYWRVLPHWYARWGLDHINHKERRGAVCYFHPWEIDSGQPVYQELPLLARLRHYSGIKGFEARLESLLTRHRFVPLKEYAKHALGETAYRLSESS